MPHLNHEQRIKEAAEKRRLFDRVDGFQIRRIRRPRKNVPAWADSNKVLRERVLGKALQRYEIAYLYWRVGWNAREIAGSDRELVFGHAGGEKLRSALPVAIADLAGTDCGAAQVSAEISGGEIWHHILIGVSKTNGGPPHADHNHHHAAHQQFGSLALFPQQC